MSDRRFGVAVVGCGGIANCHAYALTQIPEVRLIATVDVDASRARDFQARYGSELASTDVDAVLERDDVDAVVVTTANDMHARLSLKALAAGKHVLVQKPMALTLEEADQMIAAAERGQRKLMVSFFEFFHPAFKQAKELVDRGAIGDVFFYKASMAWHVPSMTAWRFDPKVSGGGVVMDGHVHHVAYFLHLLGNPTIESVYAEYGALNSTASVEDTAVTLLRTSKVLAEIDGSNRLLEPNAQNGRCFKESLEIFGSKGTIHIYPSERPSLRVYIADRQLDHGLSGGWIAPRLEPVPQTHRAYSNHFNPDENPWVGEHQHFVNCCLNDEPVISDGSFGRTVQEVLMTAYEAGRQGRRIRMAAAAVGAHT